SPLTPTSFQFAQALPEALASKPAKSDTDPVARNSIFQSFANTSACASRPTPARTQALHAASTAGIRPDLSTLTDAPAPPATPAMASYEPLAPADSSPRSYDTDPLPLLNAPARASTDTARNSWASDDSRIVLAHASAPASDSASPSFLT